MREIGSEFWDVPTTNNNNKCDVFSESVQWYLSGRCALNAIVKDIGVPKNVSLPSWCCDSIVKPFSDAGFNVQFYSVFYSDKRLVQEINFDSDILFLMDFFGYVGEQPDLSDFKGIIIRDVTHSIFSKSYTDADYFFGSLRKWCGVWTGGYAWTRDGHVLSIDNNYFDNYVFLRKKAMEQKNSYIHGTGIFDKSYLKLFDAAENALEQADLAPGVNRDVDLAQNLDISFIKFRRQSNAKLLMNAFPDWLIFSNITDQDCPMFVPVLVPNGKRNELRSFLIQNDIFCPVHWPISKYHMLTEQEKSLYDNELSLVCDQRYTIDDMHRIIDTIRLFMEDN